MSTYNSSPSSSTDERRRCIAAQRMEHQNISTDCKESEVREDKIAFLMCLEAGSGSPNTHTAHLSNFVTRLFRDATLQIRKKISVSSTFSFNSSPYIVP
jgi:hypothetical protein